MVLGPVQALVIGLDEEGAEQTVAEELARLGELSGVRAIDLLIVHRRRDGSVVEQPRSEALGEGRADEGTLAASLLGLGVAEPAPPSGESWYLADQVPAGSSAAIVLVEHRWALPLREAVSELGCQVLGDAWIHPHDLEAARPG